MQRINGCLRFRFNVLSLLPVAEMTVSVHFRANDVWRRRGWFRVLSLGRGVGLAIRLCLADYNELQAPLLRLNCWLANQQTQKERRERVALLSDDNRATKLF